MKCPFCQSTLEPYYYDSYFTFICFNKICLNDDMTRYQIVYNKYPTYILAKSYMLDKYYVQIDYKDKVSKISILEGCLLLDTVSIDTIINLDLKDIYRAGIKLKTLMVFS